jgi:HK97 family phage portal protein
MGWFDSLFNRREEPTPEEPIVDDVLLQALLNDEVITREKVMTLPCVNGAVDFIAGTIASMPIKLYKVKDGNVEERREDPRVALLNIDTNDTLSPNQMIRAMVTDYLLGKGAYAYIKKSRNDITGLYYVEDRYVTIMKVYEPIFKQYEIFVGGYEKGNEKQYGTYAPYEFLKVLRNTKDGASGVGLTVEVSKALETAYQTLLYQLGMVSTGGNKRGFLKASRRLGQDEIDTLKKAWKRLYANNSENVVVLNNGVEFQDASNSAVETQMNESKKTLMDEINALFHIYPNDFERTFKEAIYPILKAFEAAFNRDLLLEKEKKNHFFEFDVKEIIRVNIKERYEAYKLAKETGFMTLNEIRRAENMEMIEGLDVVNVGLGAVLYDVNKHIYYTPNTDTVGDIGNEGDMTEAEKEEEKTEQMLIGHELAKEFDESGNSADA